MSKLCNTAHIEKNITSTSDRSLFGEDKIDITTRSAIAAVRRLAAFYRITTPSEEHIAHQMNVIDGLSIEDVTRIARTCGLKSRSLSKQQISRLWCVPLPVILQLHDGTFTCLIERNSQDGWLRFLDPITFVRRDLPSMEAQEVWTGQMVLVTRRAFGPGADPGTYGFRWFVPSLWRYRGPLAHVMFASLFIQLFALVTPLFFQLVVDKVLVHKGLETLYILVIGLAAIGFF